MEEKALAKPNGLLQTRRRFVKNVATAAAAAAVGGLASACTSTEDRQAEEMREEGLQHTRSTCSPNCTGACGWVAAVKDGQVRTLIQASDYEDEEYNPRGCLKGSTFNATMYGDDRLLHPMIREVPYRDGGQLRECSWDEALDFAARRINELTEKYGAESIAIDYQVPPLNYINKGTFMRLVNRAGWTNLPGFEMNGDLPMFFPETFGCQCEELETYHWPHSRLTLNFGSNIMVTRLPDSHLLARSQEAGGKVICFDPNFTVTASKADEWVRLAPGSDTAIALAMAKVIIDEDLWDRAFACSYTDLPILIDVETGKRLLASEVAGLEKPADTPEAREAYVAWRDGAALVVNPTALNLPDDVLLEGTIEVSMKDGSTVVAKPGFQMLKDMLESYTPERASEISQVSAETIVRLARMAGTIKPLHIILGGSAHQWNHGDLKGRALSLLAALTGNIGTVGGGISDYIGQYKTRFKPAAWWVPSVNNARATPYHYFLLGPTETMSAPYPANGFHALLTGWANPFDQHALCDILRKRVMSGEIEFMMSCDFLHTTTVEYADVVLPGCAWYEKTDVTTTPIHPYMQLQQPAAQAPGEARPEIWIFSEFARRINPEWEVDFPAFPVEESEARIEEILAKVLETGGEATAGITVEALRKGPVKLRHSNPGDMRIPFYEQIAEHKPFPPVSLPNKVGATDHFVKSGRIEFYKDDDLFIAQGEQLPVWKPLFEDTEYALDPTSRERFPFIYLTRNSLYRIHSNYSSNPVMLELQDGLPHVWMNPDDAAEKGLAEGDTVEVYNDRGHVSGKLVYEPGLWPKMCVFEMGWWARYTKDSSYNTLIYPFINPIHERYFIGATWSPNMAWNECLCDIKKAVE